MPHLIFTIPHTSTGLSFCNLKAIVGGLALVGGGAIAIIGIALIVVSATGSKIPGPVGKGVAAVSAARSASSKEPSASEFKASPSRSGSASSHSPTRTETQDPFTEDDETLPRRGSLRLVQGA